MGVDLQDSCAAGLVGRLNDDPPVEPTWPQQRLVEHIRPVGGGDNDHTLTARETVHLGQNLIEGLLALVVTTKRASAARATNGVKLVDEDDGRCGGASLRKKITHATGTHAD